MDDMWYFNIYHCINNCSNHGICYFGFCQCYVGYYGEDCSNTSCAGTSCYYDDYTHDQTCLHACQAGYNHTDNDTYVQDIAKLPCDPDPKRYGGAMLGESNGVCDGFGTVQCAPPFLGDDCGTRDCRSNCSFNGWCSIEYPVSRCMCQPGYFGNVCEHKMCLNNCSYPNGLCNHTTGFCMCHYTYSPYNNTRCVRHAVLATAPLPPSASLLSFFLPPLSSRLLFPTCPFSSLPTHICPPPHTGPTSRGRARTATGSGPTRPPPPPPPSAPSTAPPCWACSPRRCSGSGPGTGGSGRWNRWNSMEARGDVCCGTLLRRNEMKAYNGRRWLHVWRDMQSSFGSP